MITWGVNALNHGSSLAVFSGCELSAFYNCSTDELDRTIFYQAFNYGGPSVVYWYENPWLKKTRQLYAGQYNRAFDFSVLPKNYLKKSGIGYPSIKYTSHHASHAAAGYYTSPFNDATIVVLDAIGEWECASIWKAQGSNIKRIWSRNYPNSLGLFYSAFTELIGLTPVLEEFQLQNYSSLGDPNRYYFEIKKYFNGIVSLSKNLHKGILDWPHPINNDQDRYDIAAAVQLVFEEQVDFVMLTAGILNDSKNLVYMGGCAMNSRYNKRLSDKWNKIWSLPNPGDPSSAIGAVLYHKKNKIKWHGPLAKHIEIKL
jgi:carbamoyltransferase